VVGFVFVLNFFNVLGSFDIGVGLAENKIYWRLLNCTQFPWKSDRNI
jgi:hypothetical protein